MNLIENTIDKYESLANISLEDDVELKTNIFQFVSLMEL